MYQNLCIFLVAENLKREIEERLLKSKNRQVRYSEILLISDNLKTTIGEGGFGKVYYGTLSDKTQVAIKLLSASSRQGSNEFKAEVQFFNTSNFGCNFLQSALISDTLCKCRLKY